MKSLSPALQSFFVTLIVSLGVVAGAQFVAPTSTPPNGNVTAPINSGSVPQVKQAALGLTGLQVGPTPGVPSTGYTLDVTGAGVFGSLITANARVVNIATVPNTTIPVCADATGNLGVCGGASPFVVTLSASPTSVASGSTTTLTWNAPTATSCTASGPGFTTGNATSGSDASTALTGNTTFSVTCTNAAGATQTASTTVAVTTAGGGQTGGGTTTVNISANSTTITAGQSVTLTWPQNVNITNCDASWIAGTNNGTGPTSTVSPTTTTTYTISCVDDNGATGTDSVTVTVNAAAPVVTPQNTSISATVTTASGSMSQTGGSTAPWTGNPAAFTLNWTSSPAASCTASGGWTGTKSANGSQSLTVQSPATTGSTTYTITCGGVSDSVTVTRTCNSATTNNGFVTTTTNSCTIVAPYVNITGFRSNTSFGVPTMNISYSGAGVSGCTASWGATVNPTQNVQTYTTNSSLNPFTASITCPGGLSDSVSF